MSNKLNKNTLMNHVLSYFNLFLWEMLLLYIISDKTYRAKVMI